MDVMKKSKLRALRESAGLSQNQLARKANLDRGTIAAAEAGKLVQDLTWAKIAKALGAEHGRTVEIEEIRV